VICSKKSKNTIFHLFVLLITHIVDGCLLAFNAFGKGTDHLGNQSPEIPLGNKLALKPTDMLGGIKLGRCFHSIALDSDSKPAQTIENNSMSIAHFRLHQMIG
jgi:hypothetical protein